ncbi:MAG: ankyrin repeat domain-containing protein [Candidatus Eremiobacteraeota bacterium]|nr:ankyrin repeat domain-containing protein [Candidatus Eremiobacteraeota bacterium]
MMTLRHIIAFLSVIAATSLLCPGSGSCASRECGHDTASVIPDARPVKPLITPGVKVPPPVPSPLPSCAPSRQGDLDDRFVWAVFFKDLEKMKSLLEEGANINGSDRTGMPALVNLWNGRLSDYGQVLDFLTSHGADINVRDSSGQTIIHRMACEMNFNRPLYDYLAAHGANLDIADNDGYTPLLWAVAFSNERMVRLLLAGNADMTAKNKYGLTVLESARLADNKNILRLLGGKMERKAMGVPPCMLLDLNPQINTHLLTLYQGFDVKKLQKSMAAFQANPGPATTEKLLACYAPLKKNNLARKVRMSIQKGWSVDEEDSSGGTLLYHAALVGDLATAKLLIESGADINARGACGMTPLYAAVTNNQKEMVLFLLKKGGSSMTKTEAIPSTGDLGGNTPLHMASMFCDREVVKAMLDRGAKVNVKNVTGATPLHFAARSGNMEAAALLIKRGADINASAQGLTPLQIARACNREKCARFLKARGAKAP